MKLTGHTVKWSRLDSESISQVAQIYNSPTQKGLDVLPAILEISLWSAKYDPKTAAPPVLMRRIRADRNGFIRELVARLTRQNAKT